MTKPLNNFLQIEPLKNESFVQDVTTTYSEIGTVIEVADTISEIKKGDVVYFDSWMASKFPDGKGGFYWLIPYDNVKAKQVSEVGVQGELPPQIRYSKPTSSGAIGAV